MLLETNSKQNKNASEPNNGPLSEQQNQDQTHNSPNDSFYEEYKNITLNSHETNQGNQKNMNEGINNNNNNSKNILLTKKILATKIFEKTEYCIEEAFKKVKKDIKNANKYIENKKQINVEKCEITEIINKKM